MISKESADVLCENHNPGKPLLHSLRGPPVTSLVAPYRLQFCAANLIKLLEAVHDVLFEKRSFSVLRRRTFPFFLENKGLRACFVVKVRTSR